MKLDTRSFSDNFNAGNVIAYPTEAVYGLGCDPSNESAVRKILSLKNRAEEKGLILIAGDVQQLTGYVNFKSIPESHIKQLSESWPGPVTWLVPAGKNTKRWVSGGSELVAVRVSAHPVVKQLCKAVNSPLVSTSANPAGLAPAMSASQVSSYFPTDVYIIDADLGLEKKPSSIINALTLEKIR